MTNEELIQKYLSGMSITKLSENYGIPYKHIQKILNENNVTIRGGRKRREFTEEEIQLIKEQFVQGIPLKQISLNIKTSVELVKNIVQNQLKLTRTLNRVNKRIKSNYFSNIDCQEKAYWLGFLFTDGSVDHYRATGRVRLQLQKSDEEILLQYKEDLGLDCKLILDPRGKGCYSVEFFDEQIYNDLSKYNIIPNKTYECHHIPINLIPQEYQKAFLLGLFDGDGSLTFNKINLSEVTLNFTSYYETVVQDFQLAIDKIINKTDHNKNFFTSAWHTQWRGRQQVLSILEELYANSSRFLKRKHDKYIELANSY